MACQGLRRNDDVIRIPADVGYAGHLRGGLAGNEVTAMARVTIPAVAAMPAATPISLCRRRSRYRCTQKRRGGNEGGQYSFHDITSRLARNPRLRSVPRKIASIGECTLNDTARMQPCLTARSGRAVPRRLGQLRWIKVFSYGPAPLSAHRSVSHQNLVIARPNNDRDAKFSTNRSLAITFRISQTRNSQAASPRRFTRSRRFTR